MAGEALVESAEEGGEGEGLSIYSRLPASFPASSAHCSWSNLLLLLHSSPDFKRQTPTHSGGRGRRNKFFLPRLLAWGGREGDPSLCR